MSPSPPVFQPPVALSGLVGSEKDSPQLFLSPAVTGSWRKPCICLRNALLVEQTARRANSTSN